MTISKWSPDDGRLELPNPEFIDMYLTLLKADKPDISDGELLESLMKVYAGGLNPAIAKERIEALKERPVENPTERE